MIYILAGVNRKLPKGCAGSHLWLKKQQNLVHMSVNNNCKTSPGDQTGSHLYRNDASLEQRPGDSRFDSRTGDTTLHCRRQSQASEGHVDGLRNALPVRNCVVSVPASQIFAIKVASVCFWLKENLRGQSADVH